MFKIISQMGYANQYNFIFSKMAMTKKTDKNMCCPGCIEIGNFICYWWKCEMIHLYKKKKRHFTSLVDRNQDLNWIQVDTSLYCFALLLLRYCFFSLSFFFYKMKALCFLNNKNKNKNTKKEKKKKTSLALHWNVKHKISIQPTNSTSNYIDNININICQTKTCKWKFIEAFFKLTKMCKKPKYLSINNAQTKVKYPHNGIVSSNEKEWYMPQYGWSLKTLC